ncbi:MAG: hypothetical protein AYK19_20810 [Theionarchaea archaeon DG-70-1]|nr:MAG: hypothetical protein AYK19_20810 [Theionarchaea archaeon DG-70-1]
MWLDNQCIMTYVIKSYQEEFLDAQERVGREATKDWTSFGQTPAERLRQVYSQPDFDLETRHYCFKDGELVGFLTSNVLKEGDGGVKRANLEFPLVLPGHEEAEELLFEKAIKVLQNKGVKVVRTRVSELWGGTVEMAQRWGYTYAEDVGMSYSITLDAVDIKEIPELDKITDYNHERDSEQMVAIFVREYSMTPEQARDNFESINKAGDQVVAHLVMRKEGEIVGRALALRNEDDPTRAYTGTIYVTEENQRKLFLTKILDICKEKGIEELNAAIFGDLLSIKDQLAKQYELLGFRHTATISYYEKEI